MVDTRIRTARTVTTTGWVQIAEQTKYEQFSIHRLAQSFTGE
jgi:hypothetical protein